MTSSPGFGWIVLHAALGCLLALNGCAGSRSGFRGAGPGAAITQGVDDEAVLLVRYCEKMRDKGDLVMAVAICQRALERSPTNVGTLLTLAGIWEGQNMSREAAASYRRILALHPEHAEARYGLGKAYLMLGQYDMARDQLQRALESNSAEAKVYSALGVAVDKMGWHVTAQETYRKGLQRSPEDIGLRTNLGLSLLLSAQHAEALDILRDVAADPAAGVASRQGLAYAYAVIGDMAAAEAMAMIDLPPDAVRESLAHYASFRQTDLAARPIPAPRQSEALTSELATSGPIVLVSAAAPSSSSPPAVCTTGSDQPFCTGKR